MTAVVALALGAPGVVMFVAIARSIRRSSNDVM
jgi:hypothetical protein